MVMILTSSGVSVDGYFQLWLHCCELCPDSREPRGFENNSNCLLAKVDGWQFGFWNKWLDFLLIFGTIIHGTLRTHIHTSLLDLSPGALKWPQYGWCSDDSPRVRDGWMDGWECGCHCPPENDNVIHCDLSCSVAFSTSLMAKITYPSWLFSVDELKMFPVFFLFAFLKSTPLLVGVVVNSDFGHRSFLHGKIPQSPVFRSCPSEFLKGLL